MKATTDELRIGHGIPDEKGQPLEPEEQPVDRVLRVPVNVTVGNAPGEGAPVDQPMRGGVTVESTAGDMAAEFAEQCHLCEHWDQELFKREWVNYPPAYRDRQRAIVLELDGTAVLDDGARGKADAIFAAAFGRCHALSHLSPDGILDTFGRTPCIRHDISGEPIPLAFKARQDSRRDATRIRDTILLTASGKDPA